MFSKMHYVYTIYKEQNFTKAAEKLNVSQPYLSATIKRIEQQLGAPLFERRATITPTEIGYEYIEATEKIMDIEKVFSAKLSDRNNLNRGVVNIGCTAYFSYYLVPKLISKFSLLYPKIEISLTEAGAKRLEQFLSEEEIDLIISTKDEDKKSYDYIPLAEEKILLAVPVNSKCNNGLENYCATPEQIFNKTVDVDDLPEIPLSYFNNETFILLKPDSNMHYQAKRIFTENNFNPNVGFNIDMLTTSYALTVSGNGLSFTTDSVFKNKLLKDPVVLYNIKGSGKRTVFLIKKKNKYTTNAIKNFIDTIK